MKYIVVVVLYAFYLGEVAGADPDYYWRQYNGSQPNDAVPVENGTIFVAQGYTFDGPIPTWINFEYNGVVFVIVYGPLRTSHTKILCSSNPKSLSWIPTTLKTFDEDTSGKTLVIGGYQHNLQEPTLYIGRNDGWAGKIFHDNDSGEYNFVYSPNGLDEYGEKFDVLVVNSK